MTLLRISIAACAIMTITACTTVDPAARQADSVIDGIWALTTKPRPIAREDILSAFGLRLSDYSEGFNNERSVQLNGWQYHISLPRGIQAIEDGHHPIVSVVLTKVIEEHRPPIAKKYQVLRLVLQPDACISADNISRRVGVESKRVYFPGFADVRGGWFNKVTWHTDAMVGTVSLGDGCLMYVEVRKEFPELGESASP